MNSLQARPKLRTARKRLRLRRSLRPREGPTLPASSGTRGPGPAEATPQAATSTLAPGPSSRRPEGLAGKGPASRVILLVDDDGDVLAALRTFLETLFPGVTILAYDDPRAALDCLTRHAIDLIVADFRMPHMDGVQLVRAARQFTPAPALILTGNPELVAGEASGQNCGIEAVFTKPSDLNRLVDYIRNRFAA